MISLLLTSPNGFAPLSHSPAALSCAPAVRNAPVVASERRSWDVVSSTLAALVIGFSPMASPMAAVAAPSAELQLTDFESESLVVDGLKNAGLEGDLKMMKLWARLKAGALEVEGRD